MHTKYSITKALQRNQQSNIERLNYVAPIGGIIHVDMPTVEYRPKGQGIQPSCPNEKVSAGHIEQPVDEDNDQ